jgi:hypothetical protein
VTVHAQGKPLYNNQLSLVKALLANKPTLLLYNTPEGKEER